jgi:hypothetical protein
MKKSISVLIVALELFSFCRSQTNWKGQFPAGVIYGPKGAYRIDAPKDWILDNKSGQSMELPCVLYIKGFTWDNSPVIMYGKIASTKFENIDSFIVFAIDEFKKEDSSFYHKQLISGSVKGAKYKIIDYRG